VLLYNLADSVKTPLMAPGGDLTCITTKNSVEMLLPIGMADVEFTDNNGNLLKIKDKTDIPISFSAPSGSNLPATVPQWTFNEAKGIWTEDGSLMLKGNTYTGTVSHFSPRAGGESLKFFKLTVHATECNSKPAADANVTITADCVSSIFDDLAPLPWRFTKVTNSSGDCSVKIPAGYWVYIVGAYKGQTQSYRFTSDNSGLQIVKLVFENGCNGYDLTFNLKPGPGSNSIIIQCIPAMPLSITAPYQRAPPHAFMDVGDYTNPQGFTYTKTGGDATMPFLLFVSDGVYDGWNADFTEYTYIVDMNGWNGTWIGNVKMTGTTSALVVAGSGGFFQVKSVTFGTNNPVSLNVKKN
jgi:hypothetical protein